MESPFVPGGSPGHLGPKAEAIDAHLGDTVAITGQPPFEDVLTLSCDEKIPIDGHIVHLVQRGSAVVYIAMKDGTPPQICTLDATKRLGCHQASEFLDVTVG